MQELKQMRDAASLFMIILFGRIVSLSTFLWRGAGEGLAAVGSYQSGD